MGKDGATSKGQGIIMVHGPIGAKLYPFEATVYEEGSGMMEGEHQRSSINKVKGGK